MVVGGREHLLGKQIILKLQEVRCCCSGWNNPLRVWNSTEKLGLSCIHILEDHDWCYVSTAVAVVGCRPHSHQLLIKHELVTLMDQLMCTTNQLEIVDVNKLKRKKSNQSYNLVPLIIPRMVLNLFWKQGFNTFFKGTEAQIQLFLKIGNWKNSQIHGVYLISNFGTKKPSCPSWTDSPGVNILWVWPNKVTEGHFVGDFLVELNSADLVQGLDVGRKAAVHTEYLLIDQLWIQAKVNYPFWKP